MYKVTLAKKCANSLSKFKKEDLISNDELIVIRAWISEMKNFGPEYIEYCDYWNDHELSGKRNDERASSFSDSGRIIYRVKNNKIEVSIIRITPDHDYL